MTQLPPDLLGLLRLSDAWQIWATLTFDPGKLSSHLRDRFLAGRGLPSEWVMRKAETWVGTCSRTGGGYLPRMPWVIRVERGGGALNHSHAHLLVGGLKRKVSVPYCGYLASCWERQGGGMARIYPYDPDEGAEAYMLKALGYDEDPSDGTAIGEVNRFDARQGHVDNVMLSDAAVLMSACRARRAARINGTAAVMTVPELPSSRV